MSGRNARGRTIGPDELAAALKAAHNAVRDTFGKLTPEQRRRLAANIVRLSASRAHVRGHGCHSTQGNHGRD